MRTCWQSLHRDAGLKAASLRRVRRFRARVRRNARGRCGWAKSAELGRYEPAPAFTASTLDGKPVSLDGLAGKVVLVDFWGSWCRYCVQDSGYVQSLLESFDANSFVLLEVNEGDSEERWKSYVKDHRMKGVQNA